MRDDLLSSAMALTVTSPALITIKGPEVAPAPSHDASQVMDAETTIDPMTSVIDPMTTVIDPMSSVIDPAINMLELPAGADQGWRRADPDSPIFEANAARQADRIMADAPAIVLFAPNIVPVRDYVTMPQAFPHNGARVPWPLEADYQREAYLTRQQEELYSEFVGLGTSEQQQGRALTITRLIPKLENAKHPALQMFTLHCMPREIQRRASSYNKMV